jgi:uncharacterized protein (TIGR03000 family)
MRHTLAVFGCCIFLVATTRGEDVIFPGDDIPASQLGGLIIIRQGNQTTVSVGGVLLPRRVKVKTATPEGPVVTRFKLPSAFQSPTRLPLPESAPASLQVEIPDADGLLYVEGELIRGDGTVRLLQSPPLSPGSACPLHLRAAFKVGDHLLIEDKQVFLRAGEGSAVTFDGSRAASVPLPRRADEPRP